MNGSSRGDSTPTYIGIPNRFDTQSAQTPTQPGNFSNPGNVEASAPYRVTETDGQFCIEQRDDDSWEIIGTYTDRAVADEIVKLAASSHRADDLGPDRDGGFGSHPRTAIPFGVLEAAVDDPSKSDLFADARPIWVEHNDEYQALMEAVPHTTPEIRVDDPALKDAVGKALATLTDKQREAFLLHLEGFSDREIAVQLGLSSHKSVQVRVANAKRRLAETLAHVVV